MTVNLPSKKLNKFSFWSHKTLPQVYDDSLSFYELLNKVVSYLNEVIEQTNESSEFITVNIQTQNSDIKELRLEFETVKDWVESEALTQNVTQVLTSWYDNGQLANIINQNVLNMKLDRSDFINFKQSFDNEGETVFTYNVRGELLYLSSAHKDIHLTYDNGVVVQIYESDNNTFEESITMLNYDNNGLLLSIIKEVI